MVIYTLCGQLIDQTTKSDMKLVVYHVSNLSSRAEEFVAGAIRGPPLNGGAGASETSAIWGC